MHCEGDVDLPPVNLLKVGAGLAPMSKCDGRSVSSRHSGVTPNSQHGGLENCSMFKYVIQTIINIYLLLYKDVCLSGSTFEHGPFKLFIPFI